MKIIVVAMKKGGVGKSSVVFNLADYLTVVKKKKVLIIDCDESCNLTFSYPEIVGGVGSAFELFTNEYVEVGKVNDKLDLIKGSELLNDDELNLNKENVYDYQKLFDRFMFDYTVKDIDFENKYDYVLIDTHNDESVLTLNCLVVADIVLGVSEPSRNGYRAWFKLQNAITRIKNKIKNKTYYDIVKAQPYIIANKVKFVANNMPTSSRIFLESVENDDNFLGIIPDKELIASSLLTNQGIFSLKEQDPKLAEKNKAFYQNIENLFDKILSL